MQRFNIMSTIIKDDLSLAKFYAECSEVLTFIYRYLAKFQSVF